MTRSVTTTSRLALVLAAVVAAAAGAWMLRPGAGAADPGRGSSVAVAAGEGPWVCDMHCEPGEVYDAPGKCPVCLMALRRMDEVPYGVSVATEPGVLAPGVPAKLVFSLLDPAGKPVDGLAADSERTVDVLAVSDDLSWHTYLEPVRIGTGELGASLTFPFGGAFRLVAHFTPAGQGPQSPTTLLALTGPGPTAGALVEDIDDVRAVEGYEVRLRCNGGRFVAGVPSSLRYALSRGGKPVDDLEPFMGAKGRVEILAADPAVVVHCHPSDHTDGRELGGYGGGGGSSVHEGHMHAGPEAVTAPELLGNSGPGDVVFHAVFPSPGLYRAFARFRHGGRVIPVVFTIDALPADARGGER